MRTDPNLTIGEFAPHFEDTYYPPGEPPETEPLPFTKAGNLAADSATLVRSDGSKETVRLGESVDAWRLLAVTETPRAAVIETRFWHTGLLVFLGENGPALTVRLPVGDPRAIIAESRKYPPDYMEAILQSNADLLGEKALAQGEPSFEACAGLLPELVAYVPISTEHAARKVVIDPLGRIGALRPEYGDRRIEEPLFDPSQYVGDLMPTHAKRGLLGGCLPGIHYAFHDPEADESWEEIAFTLDGRRELTYVGLLYRGEWRYFTLDPLRELRRPAEFYHALFCFFGDWARLQPNLRVDLPEPRLRDASLAAIARAITTFVEEHPKYGLGGYAADQHDGFPPTILWMTNACLEWGMIDGAKRYLTYYFDHFVTADGTLNYYGPAVSEYGQMLDLVGRYVRYTDDGEWLARYNGKVAAIASHLRSLRAESLEQPKDAITRGLLYGSPEADTRKETEYHFSGAAWAYRGLLELSRLYREYDRASEANRLAAEAAGLRDDLNRAARASLVPGDPPFVPPYPGLDTPFPTMTADRLASYTNYRYWPELLSAEALEPDLAEAVFEYRRRMGGELMATTRFSGHLDDWPFAHQARAFLAADRIDQFLLGLYGHLAVHQMPGTFCSYEQVMIDGADPRTYRADYCVPAQLTIPLLVRWMLVFEERDSDTLWLCKAVPRRWFAPGQHFSVRNAPTRWGPVSFRVRAHEASVEVEIIPPPKAPETILLRVRRPDSALPSQVSAQGTSGELAATSEAIELSRPTGVVRLRVRYG